MELTLTRRWVEHKSAEETKTIEPGVEIEYYGTSKFINPVGVVKEKDGKLVIEWHDYNIDTPLDGSDFSNNVLKDCAFY